MKNKQRQWVLGSAMGLMLLAGCASEAYVGSDDRHYHHRRWEEHRYEGRPPGYYRGGGAEIYVAPDPARPYRY
jgi:hypothetical protein